MHKVEIGMQVPLQEVEITGIEKTVHSWVVLDGLFKTTGERSFDKLDLCP